MDTFHYQYQDFLSFFAAGNAGGLAQDDTVGTPALSKNCVAVGARLSATPSICTSFGMRPAGTADVMDLHFIEHAQGGWMDIVTLDIASEIMVASLTMRIGSTAKSTSKILAKCKLKYDRI